MHLKNGAELMGQYKIKEILFYVGFHMLQTTLAL